MIRFKQKGDFSRTFKFLKKSEDPIKDNILDRYGQEGVAALSASTPKDTGLTASSWKYEIKKTKSSVILSFHNTNIQNGVPIAIILQYGHATNSGYWVEGIDYINPALRPVFERLSNEIWEEVKKV